ncbi:MAG: helix-turn-helix domain-containing GNAT family N-acetyltransferase [Bacteroidota bacterium]|nr:helix-turn-helix domain-containing GNAT family N-acetyltransferase [Bacteroidota bacterium]MDP4252955.1 helix-turn-helix domain-containing GNAT family N-acetyltransferase [Bacteroidota bacterium]MDP4259043.1 helix-turn-helix domain-containing GNAT family N-acetyltransferase [Bacteroidota bacterium]
MDFYEQTGKRALGSRLRRLSERITEQAAAIYDLYEVDLQPKWFPVFHALSEGRQRSITEIAREIGHTHPSVSQIVKEMIAKGYVTEKKASGDGRKNFVILTPAGRALHEKMKPQLEDVQEAIETAMSETCHDLWRAIGEWEFLLEQKDLLRRVQEAKKRRESGNVEIVDYKPAYKQAFKQLNEEWITRWFRMEEADHQSLDHPQEYILDKGGYIAIALYGGEPVGACALIPMPADPARGRQAGVFELAKMAVSPRAQGKGIGLLLGQACIDKARALGARSVYLESNTRLKPAISLYHKLGFRKTTGHPSPYERSDIQMELMLG